ncbi:helix-turn-helix transcriptional regulator [Planococcus faecalis]|uniref:HTH cro/C1-type domain-containing protein n=1 Tax=Planococcus faecalis TaxID=1598147 RepID=A0ABM6IPW1_9BACL|nr:helix-turn-helix transcriptional regulator [Planococcus faecalis]AQU78305.1 hypothetical protein AJGP001_02880 [Planococcus faecalis]OHX51309.1 hypothetical protein BB777_17360 [Planococcus faecalis]
MIKIELKNPLDVKIAIAERGKNVREFAKEIGISHSYMSQILSEKRQPSPKVANKIAVGLGVNFDGIFFVTNVAKDNPARIKEE